MTSSSTKLVVAACLVVSGLILSIATAADFLLDRALHRSRWVDGHEGMRLMGERYWSQDVALIAQAKEDGYERRIILPDLVEESSKLVELGNTLGFAPLGLEPNKKLYICNEGYGALLVETDRFGFRNPDQIWDNPSVDITLVGDSFAFGWCHDDPGTIAGNMQGSQVLNLSFPGALPVHYAAIVETFGPRIESTRLVLVFYANDRAPLEITPYYRSWFLSDTAETSGYFASGSPLRPSAELSEFSAIARALAPDEESAPNTGPEGFLAKNWRRTKKLISHATLPALRGQIKAFRMARYDQDLGSRLAIEALSSHCKTAGCDPLVVYIPNSPFWDPREGDEDYPDVIGKFANELTVPFLDLTEPLRKKGRAAYAEAGPHLSSSGNAMVADAIARHFSGHTSSN